MDSRQKKGDWLVFSEDTYSWEVVQQGTTYVPLDSTGGTMTGDLTIAHGNTIQFNDGDSNTVTIKSSENTTVDYTMTLPPTQGEDGTVLVNNGNGDMI